MQRYVIVTFLTLCVVVRLLDGARRHSRLAEVLVDYISCQGRRVDHIRGKVAVVAQLV